MVVLQNGIQSISLDKEEFTVFIRTFQWPITRLIALPFFMSFALLLPFSQVHAASSYLGSWSSLYPNSSSDNSGCQLCHGASTQQLNTYGRDMCLLSGGVSGRIQAIQNQDSDGDGSSNLQEINANTQPGWTSGNGNPLFSRGNCTATGQSVAAPAGVGTLDPASGNQPPVANPNGPYIGTVNVPVQFIGSASSDADGSIVSYQWDFGDGSPLGTGVNPTHSYSSTGTFIVSLTVTDNEAATDTATTEATIGLGNQAPIAYPNGPYTGTVGSAVQFNGSGSSDPDGAIISYNWDFGDGNTATGVNPNHTYNSAGTYNVTLTVMDDAGVIDSAGTSATISDTANQPPVANANGPYNGTAGVAVTFDGTDSSDPDGSIVSYDWNFGDGTIAMDAGPSPSHTYAVNGSYSVTMTVTDDAGATASDSTTANIGAAPNEVPVADANGPYTGAVGSLVQFDGSGSSDPDGSIVSYQWDFGDGSTGTGVSPVHSYNSDGSFTVTLTVTDDAAATDTDTTSAIIGVGNQPPQADANGPYSGSVGVAVQFDGSGSSDPEAGPLTYAWDFGDGSVGFDVSPSHSYSAAGTYNVTLTVTDNAGATDSSTTSTTNTAVTPPPGDDHDDDDRDNGDHDDGDHDDDEDEADDDDDRDHDAKRNKRRHGDRDRRRNRDDD